MAAVLEQAHLFFSLLNLLPSQHLQQPLMPDEHVQQAALIPRSNPTEDSGDLTANTAGTRCRSDRLIAFIVRQPWALGGLERLDGCYRSLRQLSNNASNSARRMKCHPSIRSIRLCLLKSFLLFGHCHGYGGSLPLRLGERDCRCTRTKTLLPVRTTTSAAAEAARSQPCLALLHVVTA